MDALKNFISTMTDATIQRQWRPRAQPDLFLVLSMSPPGDMSPPVDALLKHPPVAARGYKKTLMVAGTGDPERTTTAGPLGPMPTLTIAQATDTQRKQTSCPQGRIPERPRTPEHCLGYERTRSPPREGHSFRDPRSILMEVRDHPMLKRPPPMTSAPKSQNARKYYEFHEQNGHMNVECRELRKTLHELANKG
ncbi:hypothetical protein Cgig2_007478 [Carnegiea gigantea]|uniref:Uncharacterized protein n=1 Tax=Carnegiea gigantea TaxID=171969 RepID=A0A9Q1K588_9CARY|nr:hypothetical protein Cgig2_007478 [Carnegiea gigantea]